MKYPDDFINKIIQGDCLEVMKHIPDKAIDLVLTDPPYGINLKYDGYEDTPENWKNLILKVIPEIRRIGKMVILPSMQMKQLPWIYSNFPPDWLIAWYKGSTGHASYVGFNSWEPHLVYGKGDGVVMHDYFQTRPSDSKDFRGHPCPKPIEWADWFITRASKEGGIVLDCFAGSGTTLESAKKNNRKYIGIELNPKYCEVAQRRLSQEYLFT